MARILSRVSHRGESPASSWRSGYRAHRRAITDYFAVTDAEIKQIRSVMTIVDGNIVFETNGL